MRSRTLAFVISAATLAAAATAPLAPAQAPRATTLEKVSGVVQPGVVYVTVRYKGIIGSRIYEAGGTCTGFFVNPDGHFVTAGHCVNPREEGRKAVIGKYLAKRFKGVALPPRIQDAFERTINVRSVETPARTGPDRELFAAYGVNYGGLPTGRLLPARVLAFRAFEKGDVALAKIEADNVPVLELAPPDSINVGTRVVSAGYPGSVDLVTDETFDPSFKDGSISSKKTIQGGLVRVFEISAAVSPGMSGGPTVDLKGQVVGVNSFGIEGEPQPFNFISPVNEIREVLANAGVENELGPLDTAYRQGVAAYYAGDRKQALAKLGDVLGQVPENQFAQSYRAKALRLAQETPADDGGGFPTWLLLSLIALAVLAAAAAATLLMRRRGAGPAAGLADRARKRDSGGAALVGTTGACADQRFPIAKELVVGREGAGIAIDDPEVSRRHASVAAVEGGLVLTDLGSANGTEVNGQRIDRPTVVVDGDVVSLGGASFQVDLPAARRSSRTRLRGTEQDRHETPTLVVDGGPLRGKRFEVDHELLVGREGADIVVHDPEVSRRHARLRPIQGGVEVADLDSANGTVVNGSRITTPTRMRTGDVVTFGSTSMALVDGNDARRATRARSHTRT